MTGVWSKGVQEIFVLKTMYASFLISVDEVENITIFFLVHSVCGNFIVINAVLRQRVSPAVNRASVRSTAFPHWLRAVDMVPDMLCSQTQWMVLASSRKGGIFGLFTWPRWQLQKTGLTSSEIWRDSPRELFSILSNSDDFLLLASLSQHPCVADDERARRSSVCS